jgi:hypothetical protein
MNMRPYSRKPPYRRVDPLLVLACIVGLGVLVTTSVQAADDQGSAVLHQSEATFALKPVAALVNGLDLQWVERAVEHPAVGAFFSDEGLDLNDRRNQQDMGVSLSWQARQDDSRQAAEMKDWGTGHVEADQPGVYLSINRRW